MLIYHHLEQKDLARLKSAVDKLNIDKVKTIKLINNLQSKVSKIDVNKVKIVPVELQKLSDAVDNDVVRKQSV